MQNNIELLEISQFWFKNSGKKIYIYIDISVENLMVVFEGLKDLKGYEFFRLTKRLSHCFMHEIAQVVNTHFGCFFK